jgi:hypothetical protein
MSRVGRAVAPKHRPKSLRSLSGRQLHYAQENYVGKGGRCDVPKIAAHGVPKSIKGHNGLASEATGNEKFDSRVSRKRQYVCFEFDPDEEDPAEDNTATPHYSTRAAKRARSSETVDKPKTFLSDTLVTNTLRLQQASNVMVVTEESSLSDNSISFRCGSTQRRSTGKPLARKKRNSTKHAILPKRPMIKMDRAHRGFGVAEATVLDPHGRCSDPGQDAIRKRVRIAPNFYRPEVKTPSLEKEKLSSMRPQRERVATSFYCPSGFAVGDEELDNFDLMHVQAVKEKPSALIEAPIRRNRRLFTGSAEDFAAEQNHATDNPLSQCRQKKRMSTASPISTRAGSFDRKVAARKKATKESTATPTPRAVSLRGRRSVDKESVTSAFRGGNGLPGTVARKSSSSKLASTRKSSNPSIRKAPLSATTPQPMEHAPISRRSPFKNNSAPVQVCDGPLFYSHLMDQYDDLVAKGQCHRIFWGRSLLSAMAAIDRKIGALVSKYGKDIEDAEVTADRREFKRSLRTFAVFEDQEKLALVHEQLDYEEGFHIEASKSGKASNLEVTELAELIHRPIIFSTTTRISARHKACSEGAHCCLCGHGVKSQAAVDGYNALTPFIRPFDINADEGDMEHRAMHRRSSVGEKRCKQDDTAEATIMALSEMKHSINFVEEYNRSTAFPPIRD